MAGSWHFRQWLEIFLFVFEYVLIWGGGGGDLKSSSHQLKGLKENVSFPKGSLWKTE